jgi:hypothetical protein
MGVEGAQGPIEVEADVNLLEKKAGVEIDGNFIINSILTKSVFSSISPSGKKG